MHPVAGKHRIVIVGVLHIHVAKTFDVVHARCFLSGHPGLLQRGHEHGGEDRDDGDHHQQLDQGKIFS